jgi:hypothetical protein
VVEKNMDDITKFCRTCKEEKPLSEYYSFKRNRDGKNHDCKSCVSKYSRAHYQNNKERRKETGKAWRDANPERVRELIKKWTSEHPEKMKGYYKKHNDKRYGTPKGKLIACMSARVNEALREGTKAHRAWQQLVGYTVDQLKAHLEKRFKPGMTWENHGTVWEIDHKTPVSVFNFEKPEDIDFRICFSLKNLQPLEKSKNREKWNKIDKPFQPSLAIGIR